MNTATRTDKRSKGKTRSMVAQQIRNLVPALELRSDDEIFSATTMEVTGASGDLNFGELQSLVCLTLIDPLEVDKSIGHLSRLTNLKINSADRPVSLPEEMAGLTSLKSLTLYCKNVGSISPAVFSMKSLETLNLDCMEIERVSLREIRADCDVFIRNHTARMKFAEKFFPRLGKCVTIALPDQRHATMKFNGSMLLKYYAKIRRAIFGIAKSATLVNKAAYRASERLYTPGASGFESEKRKWSQINSLENNCSTRKRRET